MKMIESKDNSRYKFWKKLKDKKQRKESGLLLVEGVVVIEEVMAEGYVEELIVDKDKLASFDEHLREAKVPVTVLESSLFKQLAATETNQGMIALCRSFLIDEGALPEKGRFLYADGVQDPGNLGGMIRSAEAFHFDGVLIGPGTVDPTNDKCTRASMASVFRLPIAYVS
ncbi:MAG: TrmH family RNA methyltransferase, partial [Aedoeadaptatus pacaensis]